MTKGSDNDYPSLLLTEQAAKPDAPAAGKRRFYFKTDHKGYTEDSGGTEDVLGGIAWADLQSATQINELQGWPPYVPDGTDLVTGNLWFRSIGTPTTKATVTHVAGIGGGVTEAYERCLAVVADAANEGWETLPWTYADQPRLKSGVVISALFAVWCVGGVGVTMSLLNSDASHTDAAKVTAAAWTIVEIPAHTLADTSCKIQCTLDGAGTAYVVPLGVNIGPRGLRLGARPTRYQPSLTSLASNVDPGGADWTDLDATAGTSPLCMMVQLHGLYANATTEQASLQVRRNGSSETVALGGELVRSMLPAHNQLRRGNMLLPVDDGQIFEYKTGAAGGVVEIVYIDLMGFWEYC